MRHFLRLVFAVAVLGTAVTASGGAVPGPQFHGIAFTKGCISPTTIGDPYLCAYQVSNVSDTAHDSLTFSSIVDIVHAFPSNVSLGNILPSLTLHASGGAFCDNLAPNGSGSGNHFCTLPFGSLIITDFFSQYAPDGDDWANLPAHVLTDTADLSWGDTCVPSDGTLPSSNCTVSSPANTLTAEGQSQSLILQLPSSTATEIHNAAHAAVTTTEAGAQVHDFVTVTGQPGKPIPSGNVSIDWFTNNQCTGNPAANSGSIGPLNAAGQFDATGFAFTPPAGFFAFRAHYLGDNNYTPSDGACEPLQVVDANIQITPPQATNRVGTPHVLTCHINVNDGNGSVNAPTGTVCTVTIISGPGQPLSQNCATVGTTGDCQVTITSNTTGPSVIRASTNVAVGGLVLHRETGDAHPGDGPNANKLWVNAAIVIAPNATNEIGQPHTFTVTVLQDTGSGLIPVGAGVDCRITLTPANGAAPVPAGPFNLTTNGSGQCSATFTSATPGTVTGHGASTLSVNGSSPFTVETDGNAPNSGDAVKTFVDANIQITPQTANNPVSSNHTLVGHVNVNGGTGFANAPAGTVISFSLQNSGGATAAFVGPNSCATVGATGSCQVVISSSTTGTTTVKASTTVSVGGVSLHRETGDGKVGDSADANKTWADDTVSTHVRNAANADITGTTVPAGTVVHDEASVAKTANTPASVPAPTGTVTFTLYNNGTCNGTVVATDANKPLNGSGLATSATFTTPGTGGAFSYRAHYNGDANYPAHDAACEPFDVQVVPQGQITPTQVSCQDFISGTAPTLDGVHYPASGGTIGQGIDPGVFFFWTHITTTVPNQVVTVSQSNTSTNNSALFQIHQDWQRLYTGDCSSWTTGTQIANGTGASFTVPTPGDYVIGIKYNVKSLAGTKVPVPATITFNFTTSLGGQTGASLVMTKK